MIRTVESQDGLLPPARYNDWRENSNLCSVVVVEQLFALLAMKAISHFHLHFATTTEKERGIVNVLRNEPFVALKATFQMIISCYFLPSSYPRIMAQIA